MTDTILLVGGPMDGQVVAVPDAREPFMVIMPGVISYLMPDGQQYPQFPHHKGIYSRRPLHLFGSVLHVHVFEGAPMERVEASLVTHLLSPLAHRLMDQSTSHQV